MKKKTMVFLLAFLVCLSFSTLTVHFIDVGQGDAILIHTPGDKYLLIDAGPYDSVHSLIDYLKKFPIEKISLVIATHPHSDHISGFMEVFRDYGVAQVYMPNVSHTISQYRDLLRAIQSEGLKVYTARAGITLPIEKGVHLRILSPIRDDYASLNDWSVVVYFEYKDVSFLLMADAEKGIEESLLQENPDLKATVLKIGHHGSYRASSDAFIGQINPDYAVIMCGANNDYGYPHRETLSTLNRYDVELYRTDRDGTIVFETDGKTLNVTTGKTLSSVPVFPTSVYIGNKNSKIFHLSTCTGLPEEQNRVYFYSREEATAAGYRPCGGCNP
jgi:competence protein ComEC